MMHREPWHSAVHGVTKSWTQLSDFTFRQHIKKRDIIMPTKVPLVKAMVFPVIMYGYESWTIKKSEHQRTDALNCGVKDS